MESAQDEVVLEDSERQPCEIWSRVMGYFRPVFEWNVGKQSEFAERVPFKEPKDKQAIKEPIRPMSDDRRLYDTRFSQTRACGRSSRPF